MPKQIPLNINGFAETGNSHHLCAVPRKKDRKIPAPIEKALPKQVPLKINGSAETRNFQHLCRNPLIYPGLFAEALPPLVKEEALQDFPPRPDISIPLYDWSRDSVPFVHKYRGKLEIDSYVR